MLSNQTFDVSRNLPHQSPSVDRIDPLRGYSKTNVRLITYGMNCCLHDFGEAVFEGVARSYLHGTPYTGPISVDRMCLTPKQIQEKRYAETITGTATRLLWQCRKHAKEKGLSCSLSKEWVQETLLGQSRCSLTGIPFDFRLYQSGSANPFRPSVDRLQVSQGYEPGNVRLVAIAVNYALNEFGEAVFRELASAFITRRA